MSPHASTGVDYDPYSLEALTDPQPLYRELRARSPVHPLPRYDAYALARFEDVWRAIELTDGATIAEGPVFTREIVAKPAALGALTRFDAQRSFATWDPPQHSALRKATSPPFRPGAIAVLEAEARALARGRLDALVPLGRFDVQRDYAAPVAAAMISRTLGLSLAESPRLLELSRRSAQREPGKPGMTRDGIAAQQELFSNVLEQVRAHRARAATLGPSRAIDALCGCEIAGRRLDDVAVATQLVTLFVGGAETLPKIVAGGVRELARAPEQRAALVRDPGLAAGAFEECVRHQGVLQSVGRTLLRDFEIGGVRAKRGQRLFLLLQSANRDEREFESPDRFDIFRRPRRHLGFGQGPHHCIGIHLARMEGRVLLSELAARIPEWEVDEAGCERPESEFQIGYTRLPIGFRPSGASAVKVSS